MMATAPKTVSDVRMAARQAKGYRRARGPLSTIESIALEALKQIASEDRQATLPELCAATGAMYQTGTVPAILQRLEDKGYITREIYQRGIRICITATGQCTAPPQDQTPHWRWRTDRVPTPAIQAVRERSKPISTMIEAEARMLGKSLTDFLGDLVYIGWHEYQNEKECG